MLNLPTPGDGAGVYWAEDVRALMVALLGTAHGMAAQLPDAERAAVWLQGYRAGVAALAVAMDVDLSPRTRAEAMLLGRGE